MSGHLASRCRESPGAWRPRVFLCHCRQRRHCFFDFTAIKAGLAWLLSRADWIVPIPGTTKLANLEENIRAAEVEISAADWRKLEKELSEIDIMGDRYPADQQAQVGK